MTYSTRLGRCYELAGQYVMSTPGSKLVHGSIQGFEFPRIGHGWAITPEGMVWEPITQEVSPPKVFAITHRAEVQATYSYQAARTAMLIYKHFGPWPEAASEEAAKVAEMGEAFTADWS